MSEVRCLFECWSWPDVSCSTVQAISNPLATPPAIEITTGCGLVWNFSAFDEHCVKLVGMVFGNQVSGLHRRRGDGGSGPLEQVANHHAWLLWPTAALG